VVPLFCKRDCCVSPNAVIGGDRRNGNGGWRGVREDEGGGGMREREGKGDRRYGLKQEEDMG
jgi:hypothetical protein